MTDDNRNYQDPRVKQEAVKQLAILMLCFVPFGIGTGIMSIAFFAEGLTQAGLYFDFSEAPYLFSTNAKGISLIILGAILGIIPSALIYTIVKRTKNGSFTKEIYRKAFLFVLAACFSVLVLGLALPLLVNACTLISNLAEKAATIYKDANSCINSTTVTKVGGCDFLGNCAVETRYGEKLELKKPVSGELVCLETLGYIDSFKKHINPKK